MCPLACVCVLQREGEAATQPALRHVSHSVALATSVSGNADVVMQVRQSAGLLLKNNLKVNYTCTTDEFRRYIKVRRTLLLEMQLVCFLVFMEALR